MSKDVTQETRLLKVMAANNAESPMFHGEPVLVLQSKFNNGQWPDRAMFPLTSSDEILIIGKENILAIARAIAELDLDDSS